MFVWLRPCLLVWPQPRIVISMAVSEWSTLAAATAVGSSRQHWIVGTRADLAIAIAAAKAVNSFSFSGAWGLGTIRTNHVVLSGSQNQIIIRNNMQISFELRAQFSTGVLLFHAIAFLKQDAHLTAHGLSAFYLRWTPYWSRQSSVVLTAYFPNKQAK